MIKRHVDQIAILTSGICALHCAALPILLSMGIFGGFSGSMHHTFEVIVLIISTILGGISIYQGLTKHGRVLPQVLIALGALIIIVTLFSHSTHYLMAVGGFILLAGHWMNWRGLSVTA